MKNPKCECVDCPTCGKTGAVWVSGGRMQAYRFHDMGYFETCPQCGGKGILELDEDEENYR